MRICDLLLENETIDEIKNDVMDILMAYKQKGKNKVPMHSTDDEDGLIKLLKKAGYDVKVEDLSKMLTQKPFDSFVKRSGANEIELKTSIPDTLPTKSQKEKSEDKIDRIAKKAAKKSVKSGEME